MDRQHRAALPFPESLRVLYSFQPVCSAGVRLPDDRLSLQAIKSTLKALEHLIMGSQLIGIEQMRVLAFKGIEKAENLFAVELESCRHWLWCCGISPTNQ